MGVHADRTHGHCVALDRSHGRTLEVSVGRDHVLGIGEARDRSWEIVVGCDDVGSRFRGGDDLYRDKNEDKNHDPDQQNPFDRIVSPHSSHYLVLGLGRTRFEMGQKLGLISISPRPVHVMAHESAHKGSQNPPPSHSLHLGATLNDSHDGLECGEVQVW